MINNNIVNYITIVFISYINYIKDNLIISNN